jgi:hypothetical protein
VVVEQAVVLDDVVDEAELARPLLQRQAEMVGAEPQQAVRANRNACISMRRLRRCESLPTKITYGRSAPKYRSRMVLRRAGSRTGRNAASTPRSTSTTRSSGMR